MAAIKKTDKELYLKLFNARPEQSKRIIAGGIVMVLLVWFLFGTVFTSQDQAPPDEASKASAERLVEARWFSTQDYSPTLPLQGQLEAWQQVSLRARVAGEVLELLQPEGAQVEEGSPLLRIDPEVRAARVAQLEAEQEVAAAELAAAQRLRQGDLIANTERLRLSAALAQVEAALADARLQLRYTTARAPFAGVFDRRLVDPGDYVDIGQELLVFADISRLRATASVPQQRANQVHPGQPMRVKLLSGEVLNGELIHVSRVADPQTRSFHIEAKVDNTQGLAAAGSSGNLVLQLDSREALQIPPSMLRLDGDGQTTVYYLEVAPSREEDLWVVAQAAVEILSMDRQHLWVEGLPKNALLITQGAGFVEPGDLVQAHILDAPAKR